MNTEVFACDTTILFSDEYLFNDEYFFERLNFFSTQTPETPDSSSIDECSSGSLNKEEEDTDDSDIMIVDDIQKETRCIQITIDDDDDDEDDHKYVIPSVVNKRKFSEISSQVKEEKEKSLLFVIFVPNDIINLILTTAISSLKFNTGGHLKYKEYFPKWMGIFHVLKSFKNLSTSWRDYIQENYAPTVIDTLYSFKGDILLRNLNLRNDKKTLLLKKIRDYLVPDPKSRHDDIYTQDFKNYAYKRSWVFLKLLVYLSSDFPRFSFQKDRNQSGIPGFRVLLKKEFYSEEKFKPNHFEYLNRTEVKSLKNIYRAAIDTTRWEITRHEEKSFFNAGKIKFILCENTHHNQDQYIDDLWEEYEELYKSYLKEK